MNRKARAVWQGTGKEGTGHLGRFRRALQHALFLQDALREREGHQSGGADRGGSRRLLHHGARLPAPGRGLHADRARHRGGGDARTGRGQVQDFQIRLTPQRQRARHRPPSSRSSPARPGRTARSPRCSTPRSRWISPWRRDFPSPSSCPASMGIHTFAQRITRRGWPGRARP